MHCSHAVQSVQERFQWGVVGTDLAIQMFAGTDPAIQMFTDTLGVSRASCWISHGTSIGLSQ